MVASLVCTAAGIKSKTGEPLSAADFMPWAKDDSPPMDDTVDNLSMMLRVEP